MDADDGRGVRVGAGLEVDAELFQQLLRIGQHVHEMRDRRALIAADVTDAGLQQRLGDRENALAAEFLSGAEAKFADFVCEGSFGHRRHCIPVPGAFQYKDGLRLGRAP